MFGPEPITAGTEIIFPQDPSGSGIEVVGNQYTIHFYCANGDLPNLECITDGTSPLNSTNTDQAGYTPPAGRQCEVTSKTDGTYVSGGFKLSTTYPHEREVTVDDPLVDYTTDAVLSWRATPADVDAALEAVQVGGNDVFDSVTVSRSVYWPTDEIRWSGQYIWSITFDTRPGNVPEMTLDYTGTGMVANDGATAALSVETSREGNEVDGTFGLCFSPDGENCVDTGDAYFEVDLAANEFMYRFSQAFFTRGDIEVEATVDSPAVRARYPAADAPTIDVKDWLRIGGFDYTVEGVTADTQGDNYDYTITLGDNAKSGVEDAAATFGTSAVTVTRTGPTQAMGYTWDVTFSNKTVGGNQPDIESPSASLNGDGASIVITEAQQGNQLTGTFTLAYDGGSEFP